MEVLQANPGLLPKGKVKAILKKNTKDYCGSVNTDKLVR
jgi:hypothetical protein